MERLVEEAIREFARYDVPPTEDVLHLLREFVRIDRIDFLPPYCFDEAYHDRALEISPGVANSQPSVMLLMAALLSLGRGLNVLEIGTGTGYSAALTSRVIGAHEGQGTLTTVEENPYIHLFGAVNILKHFDGKTPGIEYVRGDGTMGYPANGPYDRIYFTACHPTSPNYQNGFLSQLTEDGFLLVPEGRSLALYQRQGPLVKQVQRRVGFKFVDIKHP